MAGTRPAISGVLVHRIYDLIGGHFRRRRLATFCREFAITPETRVLDVGGVRRHWKLAPVQPSLVVVNMDRADTDIVADGCRLPFADNCFDVAYSNSVIEHAHDQKAFAAEIRRVAKRYWVQAPDRYSLIEPHYIGPPIHRLPRRLRRFAARWLTFRGYIDRQSVMQSLDEVDLPAEKDMQEMFRAGLLHERPAGIRKSLIAVERRRERRDAP